MRVLIVGAGAMGNWIAEIVSDDVRLHFADIDGAVVQATADRHDGETHEENNTYDIVCLAVPISAVESAIEQYGPLANAAIVDLSGTMAEPMDAMRSVAPTLERISLHPLFAPTNAPGNVAIVVENGAAVESQIRRRLTEAGCVLLDTTVEEHDRAMETIQAKSHAALLAYALAKDPVPEGFQTPISAGLEALLDDLLGGTPRVYAEIQERFAGAEEVADAAARITEADSGEIEALYRRASEDQAAQSERSE